MTTALTGRISRPGNETYYPSVDEARSWRAGIVLAIALGLASFLINSVNVVLLVWLIAEVKDLSFIDGQLIQPMVENAGFRVL